MGLSILALITALVGLLSLFMVGSLALIGSGENLPVRTGTTVATMVLGLGYLLLAWSLWSRRAWTRLLSLALLGAALVAGILQTVQAERMDLGMTLVFVLAVAVNVAVVMTLFLPANRDLFRTGS
jgi:peptidoglycan/LPS O-acetylase OafA/YrhL